MQIRKNPDGTITVRIPRGPEVYGPAEGALFSEERVSAEDFEAAIHTDNIVNVPGVVPDRGWLNEATLPAALRDLVHLGDSELDVSAALPAADRPKALRALDDAEKQLAAQGNESRHIKSTRASRRKAAAQATATGGRAADVQPVSTADGGTPETTAV